MLVHTKQRQYPYSSVPCESPRHLASAFLAEDVGAVCINLRIRLLALGKHLGRADHKLAFMCWLASWLAGWLAARLVGCLAH